MWPRQQGIGVRFNTNVTALAKTDTGIAATLTDGSVEEYDVVMFATGAMPAFRSERRARRGSTMRELVGTLVCIPPSCPLCPFTFLSPQ